MLQLKYCSIEWTDYGARVVFPGGKECSAWAHLHDPNYHVIAHRCGYAYDLMRYCREHELAHAIVGQQFYDGHSIVLWSQANGRAVPHKGAAMVEEICAQSLQRWVRTNEYPILAELDWEALRKFFVQCVEVLDKELTNHV